jgi:hypothetical protein
MYCNRVGTACVENCKPVMPPKSKLPPPVPRSPQADSFEHEEQTETPIRKLPPPVPRAPQADSFEHEEQTETPIRKLPPPPSKNSTLLRAQSIQGEESQTPASQPEEPTTIPQYSIPIPRSSISQPLLPCFPSQSEDAHAYSGTVMGPHEQVTPLKISAPSTPLREIAAALPEQVDLPDLSSRPPVPSENIEEPTSPQLSRISDKRQRGRARVFNEGDLSVLKENQLDLKNDPAEKRRVTRNKIAQEIVSTERSYVDGLKSMVEVFLVPLQEALARGQPIIDAQQISTIFSSIQTIYGLNTTFLQKLSERLGSWNDNSGMGDLFRDFGRFFLLYTEFVNNHNNANTELQRLSKKHTAFRTFLQTAEGSAECKRMTLSSYLITPVQRVPRYKLLLAELLKNTPADHPDFAACTAAEALVSRVALQINQAMKDAENLEKMIRVEGLLGISLVSPSREFLKEGYLWKRAKRKDIHYMWFLFNDLLIYRYSSFCLIALIRSKFFPLRVLST